MCVRQILPVNSDQVWENGKKEKGRKRRGQDCVGLGGILKEAVEHVKKI